MLFLSAFFSGLETAFLTANKLRIELLSKRSIFPAQILSFFVKNSSHYISTMLVGNCISLVIFSIFMSQILEPHLHPYIESKVLVLLLTTLLSTIFILVAAEFLPKNLFRINPNRTLSVFAVPLLLVYLALYPIVLITNMLARFFLRFALGTKFPEKELSFGRIDLVHYIHESTSASAQRHELE
jgi:CBS domain containing-hemolysin-like protein